MSSYDVLRRNHDRLENDTANVMSEQAHVCFKVFTAKMKAKSSICCDVGHWNVDTSTPYPLDIMGITPEKPFSVYDKGSTPRSLRIKVLDYASAFLAFKLNLRFEGYDIGGARVTYDKQFEFDSRTGEGWDVIEFNPKFCPAVITKIQYRGKELAARIHFGIGFGDHFAIPYKFKSQPVYVCNTQVDETTAANTTVTFNNHDEKTFTEITFSGEGYDAAKDTSLILFY